MDLVLYHIIQMFFLPVPGSSPTWPSTSSRRAAPAATASGDRSTSAPRGRGRDRRAARAAGAPGAGFKGGSARQKRGGWFHGSTQ